MTRFTLLLLSLLVCLNAQAQNAGAKGGRRSKTVIKLTTEAVHSRELLYKETPQGPLKLHVFSPMETRGPAEAGRPCIVFFFGGGWKSGSFLQFVPQAEYFASRGLVTACADYRILSQHQTTPDKAVEDARSAIRWVRAHAAELGVDPGRIVAAGGSAGGHLAACTALVGTLDAADEDKSVSAVPDALVLFNPAMNISTLFKERATGDVRGFTLEMAEAITPNQFVSPNTPPAVLFFGTADKLKAGGDEYVRKARALGLRAEMWSAKDMPHGFFNHEPWIRVTARKMEEFLVSLGYLEGAARLVLPADAPSLVSE